ncbi:MAG: helix-hairpin-helix domain-containing protein [Bacilli bacterium]|nr:helix-hairpin-helix domain-containing protein [Bacilli bacterium]
MKVILIIVGLTALALVGFGIVHAMTVSDPIVTASSVASSVAGMSVTISGQVNRPGTFVLDLGATMMDLINAAGGTSENADTLAFNTDYVLTAKGSYYIAPLRDFNNTCSNTPINKVNINSADVDSLMATAGFSKSVASALVSYRASAEFKALEDITSVPGIGQATYMSVRDKIRLRDA